MSQYRTIRWAVTFWMLAMFAIVFVASVIGLEKTLLTQAIARIAVLSIFCTLVAWAVYGIQEYRKPTPIKKPMTAHEVELHKQAQKNRDMLKMAGIIILAIIVGIVLLAFFVHIDIFLTLSPTTTP